MAWALWSGKPYRPFAENYSPVASKPVPAGTEYLSVNELSRQMALPGGLASADLVTHLQERIRRLETQLNAVIELNPKAIETARELDHERASGNVRGPLHGIPILLKDTIETEGMQTSAGAFGLVGATAGKNAPLIGNQWAEPTLLAVAHGYEQAAQVAVKPAL
jgi:amidase